MMKSTDLVAKLKDIAENYKTLYVMGCFGAPMTEKNKKRYSSNNSYNKKPARAKMINAASADTFGFDCVCLIKGVLWGWNGDRSATYGGATYESNGVPDIGADSIIEKCKDVSTDFSRIADGELVWTKGHVGIYVGDGLVVECTPKWKNKVQVTACNRSVSGYNRRNWKKHGKLPYVTYEEKPVNFAVGDLVKITGNCYYGGQKIPAWVKRKNWYVKSVRGERVVVDRSDEGNFAICSPVNASDLQLVKKNQK